MRVCAWCGSDACSRSTLRWAPKNADYFLRFGGGAVTVAAGSGGEADGVAVAGDHSPDGAPPCPACCCLERPAGSTTSNAPATKTTPREAKLWQRTQVTA